MDQTDMRILQELQRDGRMSFVELAERVNLSKTPCIARVRRLERDGVIRGYGARLDPGELGRGYVAFVEVKLDATTEDVLSRFNAAVHEVREIQSCHMVAGGFDYLLKVRARDMAEYRRLLGAEIAALPGVLQTSTYPAMEEVKDSLEVNLDVRPETT
ncbi:MAG: winged helix-turn-helix transcriptional regulator [Pseudomonadota bacterium]